MVESEPLKLLVVGSIPTVRTMNESEEMILCNLDRLRQLIKNVKADGQFTKAKRFEDYYDEVREREEIKPLIRGTIHEF